THVVIDYLNNSLPVHAGQILDEGELEISVITRMELLAWRNADDKQLFLLNEFIDNVVVWGLDEPVILKGIEVRKKYRVKLPDAIIAATATVQKRTFFTRNIADFK